MSINEMASLIAKNNSGEQEAITGYYLLLDAAVKNNLPKDFIADIEEIISDELNHSEKLAKWNVFFTNISPAKN